MTNLLSFEAILALKILYLRGQKLLAIMPIFTSNKGPVLNTLETGPDQFSTADLKVEVNLG